MVSTNFYRLTPLWAQIKPSTKSASTKPVSVNHSVLLKSLFDISKFTRRLERVPPKKYRFHTCPCEHPTFQCPQAWRNHWTDTFARCGVQSTALWKKASLEGLNQFHQPHWLHTWPRCLWWASHIAILARMTKSLYGHIHPTLRTEYSVFKEYVRTRKNNTKSLTTAPWFSRETHKYIELNLGPSIENTSMHLIPYHQCNWFHRSKPVAAFSRSMHISRQDHEQRSPRFQ